MALFSQRASLSSYIHTGHVFCRSASENPNVLFFDEHPLKIDLSTDQFFTPPTPNRVDYPLIFNDTLVSSPLRDPRFLYLATHKLNSNSQISEERRRKEFHSLDTTNLEIENKITVEFHNLNPDPIFSHTNNFKSLPHPFIATDLSLFVSDHPPFRLLHSSITI